MLLQESRVVWQSSDLPIGWQRARCIGMINVRGAKDEYDVDVVWIGFDRKSADFDRRSDLTSNKKSYLAILKWRECISAIMYGMELVGSTTCYANQSNPSTVLHIMYGTAAPPLQLLSPQTQTAWPIHYHYHYTLRNLNCTL